MSETFWEREIYAHGRQLNRYPFDAVVSFLFRYRPAGEPTLVEVGCGAGNNLWFAAREGCRVAGVDASPSAVKAALERLAADGLEGDVRIGDLTSLPFGDREFDLAVDRAASACIGRSAAKVAMAELHRVVRPGGHLYVTEYSSEHASAQSGVPGPDGVRLGITHGALTGVGQICFYDRDDLDDLMGELWEPVERHHVVEQDSAGELGVRAEWRVVARRR